MTFTDTIFACLQSYHDCLPRKIILFERKIVEVNKKWQSWLRTICKKPRIEDALQICKINGIIIFMN